MLDDTAVRRGKGLPDRLLPGGRSNASATISGGVEWNREGCCAAGGVAADSAGDRTDGCDGEIALIKLKDSKEGAKVDTITDQLSYIAFIIGVTIGAYNAIGSGYVFAFTGIILITLIFALKMGRVFAKKQGSASLRALDKGVASLNHSGQDRWYLRFFGALHSFGRRDMFSFAAMLVMLLGNISLLYTLVMVMLTLVSIGIPVTVAALASSNSRAGL